MIDCDNEEDSEVIEFHQEMRRQLIAKHGSIEAAREFSRNRLLKANETRRRNRTGYVYVYRYHNGDEWLYQLSDEPCRDSRLELFRKLWMEYYHDFINSIERASRLIGDAYSLAPRALAKLIDAPNGQPSNEDLEIMRLTSKPSQRSKKNRFGYVYVLQAPGGYHKIGRTINPDNRIETFNIKLPFRVEYRNIIQTPDMHSLESRLHQKFAHKRINGEWFYDLTERDLRFIDRLESLSKMRLGALLEDR